MAEGFPIRRMRLVDDYGGSDFRSIEADNTSAFNCRRATDNAVVQHAYGRAMDVNPIENPYVGRRARRRIRRRGAISTERASVPGMAAPRGALVRGVRRVGWGWGGRWSDAKDYQHFSA